jgi:hypothetical protein
MNKKLIILILGTTLSILVGAGGSVANAAAVCTGDMCVVTPDTVQTPLGLAIITVSATDVVTVKLMLNTTNTLVLGLPFSIPPGPPGLPGYARTSIDTSARQVTIDTFLISQSRLSLPNLVIVTIHPPGPCRVHTSGTTVVFTPMATV